MMMMVVKMMVVIIIITTKIITIKITGVGVWGLSGETGGKETTGETLA